MSERNGTKPDAVERERRLDAVRRYFRGHHAGVEPDAGFTDRVVARIDGRSSEMLGWAAMRLLPASAALVAVLVWFSLQAAPVRQSAVTQTQNEDDLLTWVLEDLEPNP